MSILDKITLDLLNADQYKQEERPKAQIYIHHTASSPNPYGVKEWWNSTPEQIATAFIVSGPAKTNDKWKEGDILQVFNSAKWAWHLGLKKEHLTVGGAYAQSNNHLNGTSIGIEICNWGQLTKVGSTFKSYMNVTVPKNQVIELSEPYRGFKYYQRYTDAQLESVQELLRYLCNKYSIPTIYWGDSIFDVNPKALQGTPGIWLHTSVRPDKNDCFPQPEFIQMLESL